MGKVVVMAVLISLDLNATTCDAVVVGIVGIAVDILVAAIVLADGESGVSEVASCCRLVVAVPPVCGTTVF